MDVVGLGASSVDYVNVLPVAPAVGGPHSKVRISSHFVSCGGQVANALAACAALGLRTRFLGPIGSDRHGRLVREALETRGVDVSRTLVREGNNQFAVILIDERTGERIVLWDRDAQVRVGAGDVDPSLFEGARVLHVDDVDEEGAVAAATAAAAMGLHVTSDIDGTTDRTLELVASVTVPIFAEHVPAALTGESDPERALRKLRRTHGGLLCVTLGRRGAIALDGDRAIHSPGFEVEAVDTTGAGDVFRAGVIYGLLQGWPAERLLRFANAAAAVSCTKMGAMNAVPSAGEVEALILLP